MNKAILTTNLQEPNSETKMGSTGLIPRVSRLIKVKIKNVIWCMWTFSTSSKFLFYLSFLPCISLIYELCECLCTSL